MVCVKLKRKFPAVLMLAVLLSIITFRSVFAQEKVYFRNGSAVSQRVVEATEKEVKLMEFKGENPIKRAFSREGVVVAFNAQGLFLMIKDLSKDVSISRNQLENFYNAKGPSTDLLIKSTPVEVITATIRMENQAVNYLNESGKPASINRSELIAIIYQDGRSELLRPADEIEGLLLTAASKIQQVIKEYDRKNTAAVPVTVAAKQEGKPALTEVEYKQYRQSSLDKVEQFGGYLQVIADRSFSMNERDLAIKNALELFLPETEIEISSKQRNSKTTLPLDIYLKRLKMLPYGKVNIEWSEIQFVSELKQEQDGNYYGTIVGSQTFTGYGAGGQNVSYSDITKKSVKVKLESYQKQVEGKTRTDWTVMLGKIGVVSEE